MAAEKREKLGQDRLNVLVVEDNEYMLDILVNALRRLGFERIQKAKNGKQAIELLKLSSPKLGPSAAIDIVIADLIMAPINGLILLQWLRSYKESPNRFIPFVMVSGAADAEHVHAARDQGTHEFMAKPFSVDSLYKTLQRLIDKPRQFVVTQHYYGPCRRRRKGDLPRGGERRRESEDHATIVYSKDKVVTPEKESEVWLFKLPNYLRDKMGSNVQRNGFVLPDAMLAQAEEALEREAEGFTDWAKKYFNDLAQQVDLAKHRSAERAENFEEINIIAHELRGQGGTFGYPLITVFAKSLYDITKPPCKTDDASLEIVKAHIDTMRAVIREQIEGDGGEIGQALFKSLRQAIVKHGGKIDKPEA